MEDRALSRASRNTLMSLLRGVGRMEDDFDPQEDVIDVYVQRLHSVPRLQRSWANLNALQKEAVIYLMSRSSPVPEPDFQTWAKANHNIRGAELNKLVSQLTQRAWLWTVSQEEDRGYWIPTPIRAWWANTTLASGGTLEGGEHLNGSLFTDALILWSILEQTSCRGTEERRGVRWYKKDVEILAGRLYPGVPTQTTWLARQRVSLLLDTFYHTGWWRLDEKGLYPAQDLDIHLLNHHLGEAILETLCAQRLQGALGGVFWAIQSLEGEVELKKILRQLEEKNTWVAGNPQEALELFGAVGAALGWKISDLSFESLETGGERNMMRWLGPGAMPETRAPGVVQPNFEILISSKAPPKQLYKLLAISRLKVNDNYFTLHLDREYLARVVALGLPFEQIMATLAGVGQREIPQNVAFTLKDWVRNTLVADETNHTLYLPPLTEVGKDMPWLKVAAKLFTVPKKGGAVKLDEKIFTSALKQLNDRHGASVFTLPYPVAALSKMRPLLSPWRLTEDAPEDPHHNKLKDFLRKHRSETVTSGV